MWQRSTQSINCLRTHQNHFLAERHVPKASVATFVVVVVVVVVVAVVVVVVIAVIVFMVIGIVIAVIVHCY